MGFKTCDTCSANKLVSLVIETAKTKVEKAKAKLAAQDHYHAIRKDRNELARVRYLCRTSKKSVGFTVDAADSKKFDTYAHHEINGQGKHLKIEPGRQIPAL